MTVVVDFVVQFRLGDGDGDAEVVESDGYSVEVMVVLWQV